jgi:hypothetical protein
MSLGSKIKGFFVSLWHLLKPFEQSALKAFEAKITPDIIAAARDGIAAAAAAGLQDVAARDAAIADAIADLTKTGVDIVSLAVSDWQTLIQILYTAGKSELATA